jgi:hypothetical protein
MLGTEHPKKGKNMQRKSTRDYSQNLLKFAAGWRLR